MGDLLDDWSEVWGKDAISRRPQTFRRNVPTTKQTISSAGLCGAIYYAEGRNSPSMNYANVLIRFCCLLGLAVAATEIAREFIFLERLMVLAVAAVLWWYICKKTPLTKKA